MNLDAQVVNFVPRRDTVRTPKTMEAVEKEADAYKWARIGNGNWLCKHGDKAYTITVTGDKIGCSCPSMTFHCKGDEVCKHVAAFLNLSEIPSTPIADDVVMELIKAGWSGDKGNLQPPQTTSGVDGEDNEGTDPVPPEVEKPETDAEPAFGVKTYDRECPYCQEVHSMSSPESADAWLKGHMKDCSKNPKNKEIPDMKTKTKNTPVEVGGIPPLKTEDTAAQPAPEVDEKVVEPEPVPEPDAKPPTPPDTSLDADVRGVIDEAEGLGAKDIDPTYVRETLAAMRKFKVSPEEAHIGVVNNILRVQGIKRPKTRGGPNQLVEIATIDAPDKWVNLRIKVTQLWDSGHDSIRQIGLIGDETGVIKFVSWEKADLVLIEADKCYNVENVVTNEYEGTYSVAFTKNTKIIEISEDIAVGFVEKTVSGVLVTLQEGSGFITRCPTCEWAMQGGVCKEHGAVKGVPDLRLKMVIDNGYVAANVLLNREMTEKITGITLDEAKAMATEAFDANVVAAKMADMLVGREYDVIGQAVGSTTLATDVKIVDTPPTKQEIDALLQEAN